MGAPVNPASQSAAAATGAAPPLRHPPATDCLPTASSSPVPAEQRGGRAHEAPVADASVANGCMQGCAFSFLFFAVMSVVASAFEAAGVPCAGPLAAGVAGGVMGGATTAMHNRGGRGRGRGLERGLERRE